MEMIHEAVTDQVVQVVFEKIDVIVGASYKIMFLVLGLVSWAFIKVYLFLTLFYCKNALY